jgi:tetratricopeptide (TPR) repeat protein
VDREDNATLRETTDAAPADLERSEPERPATDETSTGEPDTTDVGQRIGRFVPIECIGKGGMGVVWSAYDPELDRKVAIKLIAGDAHGAGTRGVHAATRMLREARALAKLTDPNVVAVYDVGTQDDALYIAMEFVEGETLDRRLATQMPWRDVLAIFVAAGRGLAAAHAAGLVHRDFKPSNVVVTPTGRVVVLDFGLARPPVAATHEVVEAAGLDPRATEGGALLGTPAYMSPEQWRGHAVDARSDQFNFCVALWEALCRAHPFDKTSTLVLAQSVTNGRLREPPTSIDVPARIIAVLRRGLSKEPDARWPSMDALLAALGTGERRSMPYVLGLGAASACALAWISLSAAKAPDDPCAATSARAEAVWNDARKDAARSAFASTGVAFAEDSWTRVDAALDAYARAWTASATDACVAAERKTIGAEQAALQTACHGEALHRFDALVQRLGHASVEGVIRATDAVAGLPQLERCADLARLSATDHGADDEEAAAIRALLVELDAALDVADDELSQALDAAARRIDGPNPLPPALGAEVLAARARITWRSGKPDASIADLDRAATLAMTAGRDDLFAEFALDLTIDLVLSEGSNEAAEAWWKVGRAANARIAAGPLPRIEALRVGSLLAVTRHDLDRGRELSTEALTIARAALGDTHVITLRAAGDDARVAMLQGDYDAGLAAYEPLVAASRETYGAKHPSTVDLMTQQLTASIEAGRRIVMAKQAQDIIDLRDDTDVNRVWAALNLGSALGAEGRWDEADAAFIDAHSVLVGIQGVEYRASGVTCERGRLAFAAGKPDVAWGHAQQCERELRSWAGGDAHGHDALALVSGLVDVLLVAAYTDHHDDARRLLAEIEATFAHVEGDDDTHAIALLAGTQVAVATADLAEAEELVAKALLGLEKRGRTAKRTYFDALAAGIDVARWRGDLATARARARLCAAVLDANPSAHPGVARRLWLAMASLPEHAEAALAHASRLAEVAPIDPELDLRTRLVQAQRSADAAALAAARDESRVRSPMLRRFAEELAGSTR